MSAGLSNLSDDDLLRMLGQASPSSSGAPAAPQPRPAPGPPFSPSPAGSSPVLQPASDLSGLSDDDLLRALGQPAPAASFSELYRGDGSAPQMLASQTEKAPPRLASLASGLQAKADERLIGKPSFSNDMAAAAMGALQGATLNAGGNAAALVATGLGAAGVPGYSPRSWDENYRRFQDLIGAQGRQSPKSAIAGEIGGALATAPFLPVIGGAPASNAVLRAGQYGLNGGIYGALAEAIDSKDLGKVGQAAGVGALGGAVLGPVVETVAPHIARAAAPIAQRFGFGAPAQSAGQFAPEATQALQNAGLNPTALPPSLMDAFKETFALKGVSPAAIREAQAAEFNIPLSRGQATGNLRDLQFEGAALSGARGDRAQGLAQDFTDRQREAVISAQDVVNRAIAGSRMPIASPIEAGESVAAAARRIGDDYALQASQAQRGADRALEAVRGRGLPPDTLDAAGMVSSATRDAAAQAKQAYRQGYAEVARIPGSFTPGALDAMGSRVRDRLGVDMPLDDVLTPLSLRALNDLDAIPSMFKLQPGQGPDLRQVDQLRKRLVAYRKGTAANPTDRAQLDRILGEFDGHVHDAMDVGLFGQRALPESLPAASPANMDDGFPGFAISNIPDPLGPPDRAPETMAQFIARNGGLELSDDARASDFHKWQVGGLHRLARPGGRPMDQWAEPLQTAGFLNPDVGSVDDTVARNIGNEVMEALRAERAGRPRYRQDEEGLAANTRAIRQGIDEQNSYHADDVAQTVQRFAGELQGYGLRRQDLDDATLRDAAETFLRGEADDAAQAWDVAAARRAQLDTGQPTAGASAAADDVPFEGGGGLGGDDAFPAGDTSPSDAMRNARGLFRAYAQAFKPRQPGDTAGRNLAKIVERDATPNEIAGMLFGGASGRVTGKQLETLDRIKSVVGDKSDAWRGLQQATIGKYLEGRDVGKSLDYLLRGEGRDLANRVLTREQRAGLDAFRTGTRAAENARTSVPTWVSDLAAGGYDPNRVLKDLFGSGVPGARPGQAHYGRGLKQYLGTDSVEWANLRQAAWLRLIQHGAEAGKYSPRQEAERIRAFLTGEGKGLAETMFSAEERALMNRYADAVRITDIPKGGRLPDGGRAAGLGAHILNVIAGTIGFKLGGPGAGMGAYGARVGSRVIQGGLNAGRASRTFTGGAPRVPAPLPSYAPAAGSRAAIGAGSLLGPLAVPGGY